MFFARLSVQIVNLLGFHQTKKTDNIS